ncbi:MAG TPA: fumarylacetoacetate hydrolase family protein, partial [Beijerinckiaceae bacterium]|nr:fumarylacetoacetate hydrolase family protein [Beijerinckiaceae bacterium]
MAGFGLANIRGRAALVKDSRAIDVENRSAGLFSSNIMSLLAQWDSLSDWARLQSATSDDATVDPAAFGVCVPAPRSVFGIGINYRDHGQEAAMEIPKSPMVFTKFPSCLASPVADIPLTSDRVDWEVELVVVIGRGGKNIAEEEVLTRIAGYCVGQDISDRRQQFRDKPPQFSLAKSAAAYGPIGPAIVSLDSFADPNNIALRCEINGEKMQDSRTSNMIFSVAQLVSFISNWCELAPGDLIFTGTPSGTGAN